MMNCPMCGAPKCPNDPDGDGVGNWDLFDGTIVPSLKEAQSLLGAISLLRRIAAGAFEAEDPDEQGRFSRQLQDEAELALRGLAFLETNGGGDHA